MKVFNKLVLGLIPVADAFAGTKYTDVHSMKLHKYCEFTIIKGAGATGTSTITVEACDDFVPTTTEAIPFFYQAITSGDTAGSVTKATTAGFTTTAGANQMYRVWVNASDMASTGYGNLRMKAVEVANDPVLGCVLTTLSEGRIDEAVPTTAIA